MNSLKRYTRNLSLLAASILLAIAVWVLAVTTTDPVVKRNYSHAVGLEVTGLDSSLLITSKLPEQITMTLSAPESVWNSELSNTNVIRAVLDVSGLEAGNYTLPIELKIDAQPVRVDSYSPKELEVRIEQLYSKDLGITLVQPSSAAVGYEAGTPKLSASTATVSGPSSQVEKVIEVRATLDISQAKEDIDRTLDLQALDESGLPVEGVTLSPERVNVKMEVSQRGGYRNVSIKVVTSGQIASGYRLTNISSNPLVVTVYSSNPELINNLPGYIETTPLNLTDANEDLQVSVPLALPSGITVVGESTIKVSVSISPIQGSTTLTNLPVEVVGLPPEYQAALSPDRVDVIFSGPIPTLDNLKPKDVRVFIDLTNYTQGTYQIEPMVELDATGVLVESKLPASIEVEIQPAPSVTITPEK
jgi:YbbR domain-containing protein